MVAGKTSTQCAPHWSLGVPAYTKATSPIRRYTDVIVHHQLKALGAGQPLPFDAATLEAMLGPLEARAREIARMQFMSDRYWTLVMLSRQPLETPHRALVLSATLDASGLVPVFLVNIGLRARARPLAPTKVTLSPGSGVEAAKSAYASAACVCFVCRQAGQVLVVRASKIDPSRGGAFFTESDIAARGA